MKLTFLRMVSFFAIFLLTTAGSLEAQLLQSADILLQPDELLENSYSKNGNSAFVQQIGLANELELMQYQSGVEGNLARVLQAGNLNEALITQHGQNNQLVLLQQGNQNTFELLNRGNNNRLAGIQTGDRNKIVQELTQSERVYSEMIQQGNDNLIITVIEGTRDSEFKVRQIGNGMKVIIRESGF